MNLKKIFLLYFFLLTICIQAKKPRLTDFAYNQYSQFGEDGIIKKIFEIIGTTSKVSIEFGACNGLHFSNTARLWRHNNWQAILIESNNKWIAQLNKNTKEYNCTCIHMSVGIGKDNNLEAILAKYNLPTKIDLLSIDIDGNDYYIIKNLKTLRPHVIICEHNPTIPAHLDMYAPYDNFFGASAKAIQRITESIGYKLVAVTDTNLFFVLEKEFHKFESFETSLEQMAITQYLKYIITGYDGQYQVVGDQSALPYGITRPYRKKFNGTSHYIPSPYKGRTIQL